MIAATLIKHRQLALLTASGLLLLLAGIFLASGSSAAMANSATKLGITGSNQIDLFEESSVWVRKVSHSADNSNALNLSFPNSQWLFNCTTAQVGATAFLGVLTPSELRFQLTGPVGTFQTGLGGDNPDGFVHAILSQQTPNIVRMLWEDLPYPFTHNGELDGDPIDGEPDHNDCVVDVIAGPVSVGGTTSFLANGSTSPGGMMIAFPAAAVAALAAAGIWHFRRRRVGKDN